LGLLLPLLACSPARHGWGVMAGPLLSESMDRKVLWMCKKDPALVQVRKPNSSFVTLLHFETGPLLLESMNRKVLWMCKKDPALVQARKLLHLQVASCRCIT
jgi:hypothetical protein